LLSRSGLKNESEIRPFLQLVYGSAKNKSGSLVLISEGLNPVAKQVRFVSDAIISIEYEEILGKAARKVKLLKDRDYQIEHPMHYMSFSGGFNILEPLPMLTRPKMHALLSVKRPPEAEINVQKSMGYNIVYMMNIDISDLKAEIFREMIASEYLLNGYHVNYWLGPQDDESVVINDLKALTNNRVEKLSTFYPDPQAAGYSAKEFLKFLLGKYTADNAVNIVNLLAEEDFAVKEPVEFEIFVKSIIRENLKARRLSIAFGYDSFKSIQINVKYTNIVRSMKAMDDFLFWRSVRPAGPLYLVNMKLDRGTMELIEMA